MACDCAVFGWTQVESKSGVFGSVGEGAHLGKIIKHAPPKSAKIRDFINYLRMS